MRIHHVNLFFRIALPLLTMNSRTPSATPLLPNSRRSTAESGEYPKQKVTFYTLQYRRHSWHEAVRNGVGGKYAMHSDASGGKMKPEALEYPFEAPPRPSQTIEVAPGIHWFRVPLPYALDHINLWAIDDGVGWAIVDTGARTEDSIQAWYRLFANGDGRLLTRIFVTHMHPDHAGLAGWLTRKFGIRLWMTRLEYLSCKVMQSDTAQEAYPDVIDFYRRAGWSDASLESYRLHPENYSNHIHALPDSYQRLQDGEVLTIGARKWRVIVGSGHSPEHACLYCPELRVLVSGDQVLPRISSNVSVMPVEPDANPMAEWLASLVKIKQEVPDTVLVLPAHGECFRGLHARIDALLQGQYRAFDRLLAVLDEPKLAIDVFGALFARPIGEDVPSLLRMATGETVACLNHLMVLGRVERIADSDGRTRYRTARE